MAGRAVNFGIGGCAEMKITWLPVVVLMGACLGCGKVEPVKPVPETDSRIVRLKSFAAEHGLSWSVQPDHVDGTWYCSELSDGMRNAGHCSPYLAWSIDKTIREWETPPPKPWKLEGR